jgi:hypothetical protein
MGRDAQSLSRERDLGSTGGSAVPPQIASPLRRRRDACGAAGLEILRAENGVSWTARFFDQEKPHAHPNIVAGSRIRHTDGGDRAGIGAIAEFLPMVLGEDCGERRRQSTPLKNMCFSG